MYSPYVGHDSQLFSVEEHRLVSGRGDGMRIYEVNNGRGLELTVSLDRNADISRLRYKGINMNYMSPCGYVAPAYYDGIGDHFLRSFTGGFLTTCGLNNVGSPCQDAGEDLPLHGTIGNTPVDQAFWTEEDGGLVVHTQTKDETLFSRKLRLDRRLFVSTSSNVFTFSDTITNCGGETQPFEVLYHMNMGYPLLDEDSIVRIPSAQVIPRNEHAAQGLADCLRMEKPTPAYEERCFYHQFAKGQGEASIFQPKLGMGLRILFDPAVLDGFTEWKMMGVRDYVLGLECGNCYPDGRDVMRRTGMLKFLKPGESVTYKVRVEMMDEEPRA